MPLDHRIHLKLYIKTAKGFAGELNVFGNDGKGMAADIEGVFEALHLKLPDGPTAVDTIPQALDTEHELLIEKKAEEFLAECEVHGKKWYDNPSTSGGTFKSHSLKPETGFCQFSKVANAAWKDLMAQMAWSEAETKAWLEEHFGGKAFSALSEADKAQAIARLRAGR